MSARNETARAAPFVAPVTLVSLLVAFVPLAYIIYISTENGRSIAPYVTLVESTLFRRAMMTTIEVTVVSSLVSLLLGYIVALHLARQSARRRVALMALVLLPFWTSILVKSYAFTIILGREGTINSFLSWLFGMEVMLPLIFNRLGVIIGMTNHLTPFVVFPVLASLLAIDPALYRSAEVMGARPARMFFTITLPLSLSGVAVGLFSVAVMALAFFILPALLGGRQDIMLANLVDFYTREVLDWNLASAVGVTLLVLVCAAALPVVWLRRGNLGGAR